MSPPHAESPPAMLRRGLRSHNLGLIRAAARELPPLPLNVAFQVLMIIGRREPQHWPAAAVRFVGRVALEQPQATLRDLADLARALDESDVRDNAVATVASRLKLDLYDGLALWPPRPPD